MGNNLATRAQSAVAARNTNGDTGEQEERPKGLVDLIRDLQPEFQKAMPKGAEATQLVRDAMTCLQVTPKLRECERFSVLGGLMTFAQLGLRPGVGALGHGWLLPFWDRNFKWHNDEGQERKGMFRAQLVIGYQGYRELAFRSGQVANIIGRVAYENDHFDVDYGLDERLEHKPFRHGDRGRATDFYSIVKYVRGGHSFWHMNLFEAEQYRDKYAMARNKEGQIVGPWRDNFDEMAVKSTFRQLAKWMPKTPELAHAVAVDETVRTDLSSVALEHGGQAALPPASGGDTTTEGSPPDATRPSPGEVDEWEALERAREAETAAGGDQRQGGESQ